MKRLFKKIIILFLIVLVFYSFFSFDLKAVGANDDVNVELDLAKTAKSAIVIEVTTQEIIYSKNMLKSLAPASMTKIMTMILIMDAIKNNVFSLEDELVASERAASMGGTQIYLEANEKMKVIDLLKAVVIASANDACVVFAERIAGSIESFVQMMNDKADEIGCLNTSFINCNGLPVDDHYSCAYDMALMGAYLLNNYQDSILSYTSTYEEYIEHKRDNRKTNDRFWLVNTNKLIKLYPEVDGLKSGWTDEAGYCVTATLKSSQTNVRYVSVIMGCLTPASRNLETMNMLYYASSNYDLLYLAKKGEIIKEENDILTIPNHYNLIVDKDITLLVKKNEKEKNIDRILEQGILKIYVDGKIIEEIKLVSDVKKKEANYFQVFFELIKRLFLNK